MRLFVEQEIHANTQLQLSPESSHYIQHVLRQKIGHEITLFNGHKPLGEYKAIITSLSKKSVQLDILSFAEKNTESALNVSLFQGVSKADRMDITIQKTVELGISAIYPVWLERSNVKLNDPKRLAKKVQHWQKIAHSAMEQSGRTANVKVYSPITLDKLLSSFNDYTADYHLLMEPQSDSTFRDFANNKQAASVNILVGPEGGLSQLEIDRLQQVGFQGIQLGPRILRTETAALAMLSILQSLWGDL